MLLAVPTTVGIAVSARKNRDAILRLGNGDSVRLSKGNLRRNYFLVFVALTFLIVAINAATLPPNPYAAQDPFRTVINAFILVLFLALLIWLTVGSILDKREDDYLLRKLKEEREETHG